MMIMAIYNFPISNLQGSVNDPAKELLNYSMVEITPKKWIASIFFLAIN